jgi:DNA-binding response OmpR family regulator
MENLEVLVVEDDSHIREGLCDLLEGEGAKVTAAADGEAGLAYWKTRKFGLVILDVMMPGKSGYDVCREIRRTDGLVPVIMLTAKNEELDKVVGLELGADDYITKPFGVRELLARIHAVLRRTASRPEAKQNADAAAATFVFGEAEVNRQTLRGTLRGVQFEVSPRELRLLEFFLARPGLALSREKLLQGVWGYDGASMTRTVDQHIAQLRKKVEPDPANPKSLLTVHGLGYRYEPNWQG